MRLWARLGSEVADPDPDRHAGAATIAQWLVDEMMGAAEIRRRGVSLRDGVRSAELVTSLVSSRCGRYGIASRRRAKIAGVWMF